MIDEANEYVDDEAEYVYLSVYEPYEWLADEVSREYAKTSFSATLTNT